jgi:hypothetical protein
MLKRGRGVGLRLHTRLTPMNVVLEIGYAGLWRRARRTALSGRTMTTLSAEDDHLPASRAIVDSMAIQPLQDAGSEAYASLGAAEWPSIDQLRTLWAN